MKENYWNDFLRLVIEKTNDKEDSFAGDWTKHIRQSWLLQTHYDCVIYGVSSALSTGWWGINCKAIEDLKEYKKKFVLVFLTDKDKGYYIYDIDFENYKRDLSLNKQGEYLIREDYLKTIANSNFRTIDEFVGRLFRFKN